MLAIEKTNSSGKFLLAAIVAILMIACAVTVVSTPSAADEGTTFYVDDTEESGHYSTLDAAIAAATGGETIILPTGEDYTISSPIDKNVNIKSGTPGTAVTVEVMDKIVVTSSASFTDIVFSDGYGNDTAVVLIDLNTLGFQNEITVNFTNIAFDETCDQDTIYVEPLGAKITVNVVKSSFANGAAIVYSTQAENNAKINFTETQNINLNFATGGAGEDAATIGNTDAADIVMDAASSESIDSIFIAADGVGTAKAEIMQGTNLVVKDVIVGKDDGYLSETATNNTGLIVNGSLRADTVTNSSNITVDGILSADTITNTPNEGEDKVTIVVNTTGKIDATSITGNASLDNKGTVNAEIGGSIAYPDREFSNSITLSDGAVIDKDSAVIASANQEIIIAGDVEIISGGYFTVNGKLTVQDGATLTIKKGGFVNVGSTGIVGIQGDLIVEAGTGTPSDPYTGNTFEYGGCSMKVSGSVSLEGANSFNSTGTGIVISGMFEIGEEATATLSGAEVAEAGELTVYGVASGNITNNGTITVDSQGFSDGSKVDMTVTLGATGTVDVINVYGKIAINDDGLTYTVGKEQKPVTTNSKVVLENIAGVIVSERLDSDKGISAILLSGSVVVADNYDSSEVTGSSIAISAGETSNVEIAEASALGQGVKLNVNGKLTVSAEMNATAKESKINVADGGVLTVTGKITTVEGITETGTVNAAKYSVGITNIIYTTLQTALADGSTDIDLLGDNIVNADITIPVGTTVDMIDDATLTVIKDVTLTVASDDRKSGKLNATNEDSIIVNGTLVLANKSKSGVKEENVLSDTSKESGDSMTFTNIYKALADAVDGDTVEITRGELLTIDQDVEVKTGVTLLIPAGESIDVTYGATVTVNGTVYVNGGEYTIQAADSEDDESTSNVDESVAGATVVNGMFKYRDSADTTSYSAQIVGAYFGYDGAYAIAPLASVPAIANDLESDVTLYGEMTVGAIDFSVYTGSDLTIYAKNKLSVDSIVLGNVVFDSADATFVNGTVVLENGTVVLGNVCGIVAQNTTGTDGAVVSAVSGTVSAYDDKNTKDVTETGSVSFTGAVSSSAAYNTNVKASVPADSTLTVTGGSFADLAVDGTVEATGDFTATIAVVNGTINIAENKAASIATLYAGVSVENVDGKIYVTGNTDAVISGTVNGVESSITAYIGPDATVPESISKIASIKSVEYYVQSALYVTAYTTANLSIDAIGAEYPDAEFLYWMDEKGTEITSDVVIGGTGAPGKVYSNLNFNICDVQIKAIPGAIIYIDGQLYDNGKVSVGEHTINVYMEPGYTGEPEITVNGQSVANGGKFTASADTPTEISVSGITTGSGSIVIENGNGDDGLGLTDYLLIILVILIVIMAIMVAMRLMRS